MPAAADSVTPAQPVRLTARERTARRAWESVIHVGLLVCAAVSVLTTLGIVVVLLNESLQFFREVSLVEFLTGTKWTPLFKEQHFGILPLFAGTLLVSGGAICLAAPLGLGAAIYLSEYASRTTREIVKPMLEVLAGIPSVVYGVIAVTTISPAINALFPADGWFTEDPLGGLLSAETLNEVLSADVFNALSGSIVVGVMILPTIVSLSEDVLRSVPRDLRSAAFALGATKFDVTVKVVVPAALSGIIASFLLAISRAVGETMAVTLAAGGQPQLTLNPLNEVQTMTAYIVGVSSGDTPAGSLEYRTIFAVGLTLFVTTMALNLLAQGILSRMREQYE